MAATKISCLFSNHTTTLYISHYELDKERHNVLDKDENDKNTPETKPIEISIISNKIVKSNSMGINKSKDLAYYANALDIDDNDKNTHETKQIEINVI